MTDIALGKPLSNSAGLHSTYCPAQHDSADWTLNGRAVAAAVQLVRKRLHTHGAALYAAAEGYM